MDPDNEIMKRGYFVHGGDDDAGFAVVAASAAKAKKIAYKSGELIYGDTGWIDIRVKWRRGAKVAFLPLGMIKDARTGLLCGIYGHLEEYPCDACGKDADVVCYAGRALCEDCISEIEGV